MLARSWFARSLANPLTTRVRDNARFQRFSDHPLNDSIKLLHRPVESTTRKGPSDLPKAAVHIAYRLLRRIRSVEAIIQHSDSLERVRVILEWQSS
ncbi:hypothetical protein BCEP27_31036 [Burkholderia cepacia]